ncbi:hypothetical protein ACA910_020008 [Epithemia clementina (nom. ined.)]
MSAYNDGKFLIVWSFASILTWGLPLAVFAGARMANDDDGSSNNYNNNAQQNQQNKYAYNNYQANQAAQYQYSNGCYWWQWGCDEQYQAQNAQELENESPWWWLWSEDERRSPYGVNPTLVVIYLWLLFVIFLLTSYGRRTVVSGGSLYGVSSTCLMFANYCFISMLYIGGLEGAVDDDSQELDADGWYGQFGVLLYLTNLTGTIFGITYYFAFRRLAAEKEITKVDVAPSDYMNYHEPSASPSSKHLDIAETA